MKATQGHLRIDQSYKLISCEYNGKYSESDLTAVCWQCENCDKPIANIATVVGSIDGREYKIGLDCASTLTGIIPSEVAENKKKMARESKFRKWIMENMLYWITDPDNKDIALLYSVEPRGDNGSFKFPSYEWRCSIKKYSAALSQDKKRTIVFDRVDQPFEDMPDLTFDLFKFA